MDSEADPLEPARAALRAHLLDARVEGTSFTPETGLVALGFWLRGKVQLGVGVGPRLELAGWLPRPPRQRASVTHPLVAAMRAHLEGHRVREVSLEDGVLWLSVGGAEQTARLALTPGRKGLARVFDVNGRVIVRWPADRDDATAAEPRAWRDLERDGAGMFERGETLSLEALRQGLARAANRKAAMLLRRAEAVRADLARLDDVQRLQKIGRLLLAQGPKLPRGLTLAHLEDWEEGGTLEVPLDPALPAKQQAERFFDKARRLQRGEKFMRKRLEDTERAWEVMQQLADDVAAAPMELVALEALQTRARALGLAVSTQANANPQREAAASRRPFVKFAGAGGRPILVGRGGADNDALTSRFARPHDLWLHVKDRGGAHVVVPLEKGQSCPAELLVDAATLAAHHSEARGETTCEVSYLERRYVRKPKGSAPGAVTYDREKVLVLRVEPERVQRLLAQREE